MPSWSDSALFVRRSLRPGGALSALANSGATVIKAVINRSTRRHGAKWRTRAGSQRTTVPGEVLNIGQQIRDFRERERLTVVELGELVGYTGGYISMIERNLRDPRMSTLESVSSALHVPLLALLIAGASEEELSWLGEKACTRLKKSALAAMAQAHVDLAFCDSELSSRAEP
jgi:transcriptional regulator with XRE-family HTH domain